MQGFATHPEGLAQFAQQNNHPNQAANFASQAAQVRAALGLAGK